MKLWQLLAIVPLLAGCETTKAVQQARTVDTFCLQSLRTWSVNDSSQTIREAEVFNATLVKRCGKSKS